MPKSARYRAAVKSLDALYATIPTISCKGLCAGSCGPVPRTNVEDERMTRVAGNRLPLVNSGSLDCSHLEDDRCSIYEQRPTVCRLWGVVDNPKMRCPHGCAAERILTPEESQAVIRKSTQLGGGLSQSAIEMIIAIGESNIEIEG